MAGIELAGIRKCVGHVARVQLKGTTWPATLIKDDKNPAALALETVDGWVVVPRR